MPPGARLLQTGHRGGGPGAYSCTHRRDAAGAGFGVFACASAEEAVRDCEGVDSDAVVTDINLGPGPSGLDLVECLAREAPHIAVLVPSKYPIRLGCLLAQPASRPGGKSTDLH